MTRKPKKCRICGTLFRPVMPLQAACSIPCSIELGRANQRKKEAREHREAKRKAKTRAQWMREAQAAFNAWVRRRDEGKPCISCGRMHEGQWHAGHYRTTKAAPELRFHPLNVWRQCSACNVHLSGNITAYRASLVSKLGLGIVEWLEGHHEPVRWSIEDLQEIKAYYSRLKD
jgi:hypothetical protein